MRYIVRQKIFAFTDSFAIKDEFENDVFQCRKQFISLGNKLRIYDPGDNELCYIEQKLFKFMPEYDLYIADQHIANVRKKFAFFRNDFEITGTGAQYYVEGDFWGHEFQILKDGVLIASISKRYFSFTDTYGVEIDDDQDQLLGLSLAIVIDMVCHDHDK